MRYIPMSKYSFEEICQQCSDAINRTSPEPDFYDELCEFEEWEEELTAALY